ncbi:MAG: single-stranded DNA-binding protein [Campylobacteraceae bacterium]|jgi:single-strand DNA-binding protein|nr:single-stranded DNA-binding protein [Campylobacteraceae bacterium]
MANVVVISGRLVADAKKIERQTKEKNFTIVNFTLAHNHNKDKSSFFDVTLYGEYANTMHQYLVKGKDIVVTGHLIQNSWKDADKTLYRIMIEAHSIDF